MSQVRPNRLTLTAVVGLIVALGFGAVRELIWDELKGGMLNLHGLRRPLRVLVVFGFALLLTMLVAMVFNDLFRRHYDLLALPGGTPGRGSLIPSPLLPVTLFVLAVGWAFVLASVLDVPIWARLALLAVYVCFASVWQGFGLGNRNDDLVALGWVGVLAVVALFAIRLKVRARPVLDFSLLLAFVTITFAAGQYRLLDFDRSSGGAFGLFQATQSVSLLSTFVLPLMFLIGLDIAAFALNIGEFGTHFIEERFSERVLPAFAVITAALAGLQVVLVLRDTFDEPSPWKTLAGAALLPLAFAVLWKLVHVRRRVVGAEDEAFILAARAWAPRIVVLVFLPLIIQTILLLTLNFVNATNLTTNLDVIQHWEDLSTWVADRQPLWSDLLGIAFLLCAAWLASRHRRNAALFVGGVGVMSVFLELTGSNGWLSDYATSRSRTTSMWTIALLVTAIVWISRRQLSRHRVRGLLLAFGLALLLGRQGFLEDPIGVFSFLGIALIAMGFVADATAYGDWANRDTPRLPRVSRVLLYVGYVLFAVALVNWALVSHDLADTQLYTGQGALAGFAFLGQPLIFLVFLAVITSRPDPVTARTAPPAPLPPPPSQPRMPAPPPRRPVGVTPTAQAASGRRLRLRDEGRLRWRPQAAASASLSLASTD